MVYSRTPAHRFALDPPRRASVAAGVVRLGLDHTPGGSPCDLPAGWDRDASDRRLPSNHFDYEHSRLVGSRCASKLALRARLLGLGPCRREALDFRPALRARRPSPGIARDRGDLAFHDAWPASADRARPVAGHCLPRVNDCDRASDTPVARLGWPRSACLPLILGGRDRSRGGRPRPVPPPTREDERFSRSEVPSIDRSFRHDAASGAALEGEPSSWRSRERGRHDPVLDVLSQAAPPAASPRLSPRIYGGGATG